MPKKPNPETPAEQLELFPGFDPRQRPLFPGFVPRRVVVLEPDELGRFDSIGGPMNDRIWDAEFGS